MPESQLIAPVSISQTALVRGELRRNATSSAGNISWEFNLFSRLLRENKGTACRQPEARFSPPLAASYFLRHLANLLDRPFSVPAWEAFLR
ncbi:MAG: hypothetical protein KME26_29280 [Oscillatoria princeps RMCB-10]|nr:hypothetical protein [Oscillatoria princeps RMCB-10]